MERQRYSFMLATFLGVFAVLVTGGVSAAGPPPIPAVWEMFSTYSGIESHIRNGQWDAARDEMKELEKQYILLADQLKPVVDGPTIQKFRFVIGSLKKRMELRDREQAEKPLLMLQNLFLDIMEYYEYPVPPGVMLATLWVQESVEYLEAKNLAGVGEEMAELFGLRPRITDGFKKRNVSPEDIDMFFATAEEVSLAARDRYVEQVEKGLAKLQRMLPEASKEE